MANLPSAPNYITIEATQMGSAGTEALAQAIGQSVNWVVDNARGRSVGSLYYSTLTELQFQAVAGVGWVLADGRALLVTDQLRVITGLTTVPDMRGTFQREGAVTGVTQPSSNASHTHTVNLTHNVSKISAGNIYSNIGGPSVGHGVVNWSVLSQRPIASVGTVGATEFCPKYTVFNIFMRIN